MTSTHTPYKIPPTRGLKQQRFLSHCSEGYTYDKKASTGLSPPRPLAFGPAGSTHFGRPHPACPPPTPTCFYKNSNSAGVQLHLECPRTSFNLNYLKGPTSKCSRIWGLGFGIVNKAEIDVFLELSCFFNDPADAGNLISGSSAFSKTSLNIWKFTVRVLLKPGLENFEHYFTSM